LDIGIKNLKSAEGGLQGEKLGPTVGNKKGRAGCLTALTYRAQTGGVAEKRKRGPTVEEEKINCGSRKLSKTSGERLWCSLLRQKGPAVLLDGDLGKEFIAGKLQSRHQETRKRVGAREPRRTRKWGKKLTPDSVFASAEGGGGLW